MTGAAGWKSFFAACMGAAIVLWGNLAAAQPVSPETSGPSRFTICTDVNFWAPYTFVKDGKVVGLHVDLARRAFGALGLEVEISPRPWNRCMAGAADGFYDAVLSAGYQPARAEKFYYPADAETAKVSPLRVTQAEYVVVTRAEDRFDWQGDDHKLPAPVGIPMGYASAGIMRDQGIEVRTATKYADLFRMLARGRVGSLVVVRPAAEFYLTAEAYERDLTILDRPYRSNSYFMLVSRKGAIGPDLAQKLWQQIADIRDDKPVMESLTKEAMAELEACLNLPEHCQ